MSVRVAQRHHVARCAGRRGVVLGTAIGISLGDRQHVVFGSVPGQMVSFEDHEIVLGDDVRRTVIAEEFRDFLIGLLGEQQHLIGGEVGQAPRDLVAGLEAQIRALTPRPGIRRTSQLRRVVS